MATKKPPQPQLTVIRTDTKPAKAKPAATASIIVLHVTGDAETVMAAIDQAARAIEELGQAESA